MKAEDYRPQYDDSVVEWLAGDFLNRPPVNINKAYCLIPSSAMLLASLFASSPKVVMLPPTPQASGSPFVFNHWVPWFEWPNGARRNAALLAGYWGMPGVLYSQALEMAQRDIDTTVEGQ